MEPMNQSSPQLRVYRASAGSGKTFTLAVEYIKILISNPASYRNILAVTFTNKATAEMKNRILSCLYGIKSGDSEYDGYLNSIIGGTDWSEELVRGRAGRALSYILHDYSRFRVETIDTFFQSVMRNLARELGIGAAVNVDLNSGAALDEAVDLFVENLRPGSRELSLLIKYIEERIRDDAGWDVTGIIKSFARNNIFNEDYAAKNDDLRRQLKDGGVDIIVEYKKKLWELIDLIKEQMDGFASEFASILESKGLDINDLCRKASGPAGYFKKIGQGEYSEDKVLNATARKAMSDPEAWTTKKSPSRDVIIEVAGERIIPLMERVEVVRSQNCKLLNSARLSLEHLNNIPLLGFIREELRLQNEEQNRFLLAETNALLHGLVKEHDPSFVYEKIGARINHIMIDEFQDTSRMQWENFRLLLEEGLGNGNDSLIVGDVKQSIYRWRGGDWNILNGLRKVGDVSITPMTLDHNFRSSENVVEFNNKFFSSVVRIIVDEPETDFEREFMSEVARVYNEDEIRQKAVRDKGCGMAEICMVDKDRTMDVIASKLCEFVEAGIPQSDIAILVRKNSDGSDIATYFEQNPVETSRGLVRIVSDEAFRLSSSVALCIMMDAARLLADPDDLLARARLAAGYARHVLMDDRDIDSVLMDGKVLPEAFEDSRDELCSLPPYELMTRLYEIFGLDVLEGKDGEGQSAYLCAFYDNLAEYLESNTGDLTALTDYWDEKLSGKTIPAGAVDGVRILSIHKSKGLEFPTVIVPFADWSKEVESPTLAGTMWISPSAQMVEPFNMLKLVPISYKKAAADSVYMNEYFTEKLQLTVDNLNLLYVAFTRAGNNLVVITDDNDRRMSSKVTDWLKRGAESLVDDVLMEKVEDADSGITTYRYGKLFVSRRKDADGGRRRLCVSAVPVRHNVEFRQSNKSADFMAGGDGEPNEFVARGQILHKVLSWVGSAADVPRAMTRLEMEGVVESRDEMEDIRQTVVKAVESPEARNWFDGSMDVYNERSIIMKRHDGTIVEKRPDRVMVNEGKAVVVDYKFGIPMASHRPQVQEYINLLSDMGYRDVEGYLWYVDKNKVEKI